MQWRPYMVIYRFLIAFGDGSEQFHCFQFACDASSVQRCIAIFGSFDLQTSSCIVNINNNNKTSLAVNIHLTYEACAGIS